jgi:transcription-repair coupling factor (superfamily II helicase)
MIKALYQQAKLVENLATLLKQDKAKVEVEGLIASAKSLVLSEVFDRINNNILLIFQDKEEAAYYLNDFEKLLPEDTVLFYPSSYRRPYQIEETDNANILLRTEVLNRLNSRRKPAIIVTYTEALFEKVITKKELDKNTLKLSVGDKLSLDFINETLFEYEFKRVDFVTEPGEFSVRGGIVDVFSYSFDLPYRLEFFGDEVESIRTFDVETQLSTEKKNKMMIVPNVENKRLNEIRESFLSYISNQTIVYVQHLLHATEQLDELYEKAENQYKKLSEGIKPLAPATLFIDAKSFVANIQGFRLLLQTKTHHLSVNESLTFNIKPQPAFNKQFDLLLQDLEQQHRLGFQNYLLCSNDAQKKRFEDIFSSLAENQPYEIPPYKALVFPCYEGFIDEDLLICCYTDHQIFERYHKFNLKSSTTKKQSLTLKELNTLQKGDYVTHIDHGIGRFAGLQKIDMNGSKQEAIKLLFADNDIVYVSIHALHKISKFNGKDGTTPKIYKVGSKAWKILKEKTKIRVKQIAFDLIQLYAKRRLEKGFACAPDSYLQNELESSFIYEDTPDQLKSTMEIKTDMESDRPMDRLVCGDVGFGKTEVAIRAAFKAVDNSKQVAVLVPTTILAYQHYRTFTARLKDLPVNVNYLNRFRSTKQKNEIINDLETGKLDIVIGTHQLVSKNIKFKDLGLLIIDEEQKFGVNVKDKLKTIAHNVDTLTLTATPIPRTLQFSLMAARDLSVITTPPPNRHPIETKVIRFNEEEIRDAVAYEIQRGGQVFIINNRIENIKEVAGMVQRLVPDAKIGIGHGQLDGKKLEELMLAFINGEFDVLIATTIVESGLDVPNANTIIINNAHQFGLSDLHQMRGRVGRSNKKAFCYFVAPPLFSLTEEARKRIQALEQHSGLGSGFQIAMKDLEIRGAGDLLGGEQSGFINDIGFETYQKIMNEAILELKENEFKDLYEHEESSESKTFVADFQLDSDQELLFSDDYINQTTERLTLYQDLSKIENENQLEAFEKQLIDRFGPLPKAAQDLLLSVQLKWLAINLGFEKIIIKDKKMTCYFIANQASKFYESDRFVNILQAVQNNRLWQMKEKETKSGLRLMISTEGIKTIKQAKELLEKLVER